eukprot:jgi/Undpi1/9603/HiC_scaffold_27.g12059.m1
MPYTIRKKRRCLRYCFARVTLISQLSSSLCASAPALVAPRSWTNAAETLVEEEGKAMPEFHFMESDWGTHAKRGGSICTASALACMVLGFVFFSILGAFLALGVGLVLATFETPWVYKFLGPCRRLEDILNENFKFSMPAIRAVFDFCLAVLCFWSGGINEPWPRYLPDAFYDGRAARSALDREHN